MDNEIKLNGKWLIPDTNEELTGILYINRRKKQILKSLLRWEVCQSGLLRKNAQ